MIEVFMYYSRLIYHLPSVLLLLALLFIPACASKARLSTPDREGILLVAFGTSQPGARAAFSRIEEKYREAFPHIPITWAFTSRIIRNKLADKGMKTATLDDALRELAALGVNTVRVQSLHIMSGEDFSRFARALIYYAKDNPYGFKAIYLGQPLLDSRRDGIETAQALERSLAQENRDNAAVILMGHGQKEGRAGLAQEGAQTVLHDVNPHFYLATVEGEREFAPLPAELKKRGVKKVFLAPFMLVAGEHVHEDLAGRDDSSWLGQLRKAGFEVSGVSMKGLGERDGIAEIFIRHTRAAHENLLLNSKK